MVCIVETGHIIVITIYCNFFVFSSKLQILQDFTLLFGSETASRLLERWPTVFKAKVIRLGETLTPTPLLKRLLSSAKQSKESSEAQDSPGETSNDFAVKSYYTYSFLCRHLTKLLFFPEWDSDISSFLLLLHLLSPQASGRKKIQRISISQAIDHLVVFHKVGIWYTGAKIQGL